MPTVQLVNKPQPLLCSAVALLALLASCALARAQGVPVQGPQGAALEPALAQQAHTLLTQAVRASAGTKLAAARVEVSVGHIDPRLTLAPCRRAEPYLPSGMKVLGRTRVGLRCVEGTTLWNVTLPVTVALFAPGIVLGQALPAGSLISEEHLSVAEIDWAADGGRAFADTTAIVGRELARPLAAGQSVRSTDLKHRLWFAAGETVQLLARGVGFTISTDGQALNPGLEGQPVRVRTASGRVVSGRAIADRQVEVQL